MTTVTSDNRPNQFLAHAKAKTHQANYNGQPKAHSWNRIYLFLKSQ